MENLEDKNVDDALELMSKDIETEAKQLDYMLEKTGLSREEIKEKAMELYSKHPKLRNVIRNNMLMKMLGLELPSFIQDKIDIELNQPNEEKIMAKKKGKVVKEPTNLPKVATAANLTFETTIAAKVEGFTYVFSSINDHLSSIANDVGIWKNLETRLVSLLETLLARMDSIGNVAAQSAPSPIPADILTQGQIPGVVIAPGIQPPLPPISTAPQLPPLNQVISQVPQGLPSLPQLPNPGLPQGPVGTAPLAPVAPVANKGPAERLQMDGSAERGTADPAKGWSFVNVIATPIEFTKSDQGGFKAMNCTLIYVDKNKIQRISWDAKFNRSEIWLAKSLISPETIIKLLQVQQYVAVPNWWADKNTIPMPA